MADLIAMPERCTCAEVHGEDPNCALHGVATEWALENILPRDWQEMVLEQAAELEKLAPLAISLQATAEAAAHSTSELTALRERDRRTLTDPQRLIWRDDVEGICPTPDMCFEYGEHARCGPCAIKQADARGVISDLSLPNLPEVSRLQRENAALRARVAELEEENDRLTKTVGSGILGELLNDEETDEFVNFIKFLRGQSKEAGSGKI